MNVEEAEFYEAEVGLEGCCSTLTKKKETPYVLRERASFT